MQKIIFDLSNNEAEIKSVDGEISNGNIGSVELQLINAPANWTNEGDVWATFIKNGQQHPKLTTYIASENRFVTLIPSVIFEDDRSFGIFVYYITTDYVETRRIIEMPIAETGRVTGNTVSAEESSQVVQKLQDMSVLYKAVSGAEENRYQKYYKAEGITAEELESDDIKSRYAMYDEAETNRNNMYIAAEGDRNSWYALAEKAREENEETRQTNETEREKAETNRNQKYAVAEKRRDEEYLKAEDTRNARFDEAEDERKSNENQRISDENARKTAEIIREANEVKREEALGKILVPGSETIVNRAECDDEGNKIRLTYASKTKLDNLIVYGNVVYRAESDDMGNKIRSTYARKDEIKKDLNIVHDIISLDGDAEIDAIPDARAVKVYGNYIQTYIVNYVDRAIGDIETSLENIILKYGLGGGNV